MNDVGWTGSRRRVGELPAARLRRAPALAALAAWLSIAGADPARVRAQVPSGTPADAALDELRVRAPAGENDDRTIDAWISEQLAGLDAAPAPDQRAAAKTFRDRFKAQASNPRNAPEFTERLALRTAASFEPRLGGCTSVPVPIALAMAWVLSDFNHVGVMDGLKAGLGCSGHAGVRYVCAKGLAALGPKFTTDRLLTDKALQALREAGTRETNSVVVAVIYRALQYDDRSGDATGAMLDILAARLDKRRQAGLPVCDGGELDLLEFLLKKPPPARAINERLVPQLAVMLRLDVQRVTQEGLGDVETVKLATSIDLVESLFVRIVAPPADQEPRVRRAMKKPKEERLLEMQIELNKWIGTEQTPGLLNAAPWNVPVGAP